MARVRVTIEGPEQYLGFFPEEITVVSREEIKPPRRPLASLPVGTVVKFTNEAADYAVRRVGKKHMVIVGGPHDGTKGHAPDFYDGPDGPWADYEILFEPGV